jgi:hypothetical protein
MDNNEYDIKIIQTIISKIRYDINLLDNNKYSINLKHGIEKYLKEFYFLLEQYKEDYQEVIVIKIYGLNNIDNIAFQNANKENKMYLLANRMLNSNINFSKINLKQEQELLRIECDNIYIKLINELNKTYKIDKLDKLDKLDKITDGFSYKDVNDTFLITLNNYIRDIKLGEIKLSEKLIDIINDYHNEFKKLLNTHKDNILTTVILYDISFNSYLIVRDKFKYENDDFYFETTRFYNNFLNILDSPKQLSSNNIEKNRLEKVKKDEEEKNRLEKVKKDEEEKNMREHKLQEKRIKDEGDRLEKIRKDEEIKQLKKKELDEAFKILHDAYESIQNMKDHKNVIKEIKNDKLNNEYNEYNYIVIE